MNYDIIQDTFILRNYRNRGLGKLALKKFFDLYSGKFGLDVLTKNKPAEQFWKHCLEQFDIDYISEEVISDGDLCTRLFLDSK